MKALTRFLFLVLFSNIYSLCAQQNDISARTISIGSNSITAEHSAAIGAGNYVPIENSLYIGYLNGDYGNVSGYSSLVIGEYNFDSADMEVFNSVVVGRFVSGAYAGSGPYSGMTGTMESSLVVGGGHSVSISNGLVAGFANYATGGSFVLGMGLIAYDGQIAFGKFNAPPVAGQLFVVGNGTHSTTDRRNAFEIYNNGAVRIPARQGDVGMGRFGRTGDQ